ncbi:hypothetical protein AWW66_04175 [Micromonospora rosaria]|uniref:Integral membrane protein n=1 Tax=Micromonospora rosaria TaxID=47874 RepID=A0A136PXU0_9ACTN|nr:hypothetical protein [Micromonospora rosaria]KXK63301.1 hypothetical protein AWW66_04175 [Micromonospora rosaria]
MAGRVLELRVHGVSNTPPDQILGLRSEPGGDGPRPWLVAGDEVTGFYRSSTARSGEPLAVEAYSWGQLTSGARTAHDVYRALWTLLLPFALANVALHARPGIPPDPDQERWSSRSGITAWLIRLFCLSLTGTLALTATGVGVDLIGWQCVDQSCLSRIPGPWEFLGQGWWSRDTRSLAVGLLVPLGLLAVLGLLGWRTYQYEAQMPARPAGPRTGEPTGDPTPAATPDTAGPTDAGPAPDADPAAPRRPPLENPLQDPTFWGGEGQLRRSAVLHLCVGTVIAAAVPLGSVIVLDPPRGAKAAVVWPTVALFVAVLVIAVVALGRPWLSRRAGATPLGRWSMAVIVLTCTGLAGTFVVLLLPDGPAGTPLAALRPPAGCADNPDLPGCDADCSLAGYDWYIGWFSTGQLLLLIAIGAVARSGRRALALPVVAGLLLATGAAWLSGWLPDALPAPPDLDIWLLAVPTCALAMLGLLLPRTRPAASAAPRVPHTDVAWGGRAPAVIAGFGWLLTVAYCAGALYWATDRLNNGATPSGRSAVIPPIPVLWAGLVFIGALLALLAVTGHAVVIFTRLRRREYAKLVPAGNTLSAHEIRRSRDVSRYRALHRLVGEHAINLVGRYSVFGAALAVVGCAAALSHTRPHPITVSGWHVAVKTVADIGDSLLGWLPVAAAALGLLVYRNETARRSVGVIWDIATFWPRAAHPLAPPCYAERAVPELQTRAAGLLALDDHDPRRVDGIILSGHSQGTVICAAVLLQLPLRWRRRIWFFSYGCQFTQLYGRVFPAYFGPDRLPVLTGRRTAPAGWTNFWRATDPLGWPVDAGERDVPVRDPEALHPSDGEVCDPPIRNHSGYPESPEFGRERARVARLLRRAVPSQRQGVG